MLQHGSKYILPAFIFFVYFKSLKISSIVARTKVRDSSHSYPNTDTFTVMLRKLPVLSRDLIPEWIIKPSINKFNHYKT